MVFTSIKMTDIRQSINYKHYLESQGWIVERIDNTNYFLKKLPLIGSILKLQRPKKIDIKTIQKLEKKYKVFQTIIEPINQNDVICCMQYGYKLNKSPYLPSKTLNLNLAKPLKFNKETRRCIKIGEIQKIKAYSSPKQLEIFHNAWKKSVNFNRYVPSLNSLLNLRKSFPNNHSTFLASHNKISNIIGGALFTRSLHDYGYYWYGFTNKEGRTSLSQYSLLYSGILWAKRMGCKVFDFEGIYDPRFPNKSWLGFTHFKKSFGGKEILYPGCFVKFRLPLIFAKHFKLAA